MSDKLWSIFTILILITLHLKIATVGGFGISLAFILIPFWIYSTFKIKVFKFKKVEFFFILFMLFLPFIPGNITNWGEFFKTYFQFVVSFFLGIRIIKKKPVISANTIDRTLSWFQFILTSIVILQFLFVSILGYTPFYNIFGDYQLYYQRAVSSSSIFRMKAFYLEPSYLGFVVISLYWTRLYIQKRKNLFDINFILTVLVLIFANSAFANISFIIIFTFNLRNYRIKLLNKLLLLSIALFVVLYNYNTLLTFLRLDELIFQEGNNVSSGYMRIVLPIQVLFKMIFINGHFWGLTFGQLDQYVYKFFIDYKESSISNSFFLIIGYWGVLGILFYILMIFIFLKSRNEIIKSFILLTILNLNNSGAFVTTQFVFMAIVIPGLAIYYHEKESINNNCCSKQSKGVRRNL